MHLALGRSYPETGGTNESVVHWDLICDLREGGGSRADGEVILADRRVHLKSSLRLVAQRQVGLLLRRMPS